MFIVSGVSLQYCVILDVEDITDATAVGILLQRYGYKIVSAQVTPSIVPFIKKRQIARLALLLPN